MFCKITLIGNLSKDPETRYTPSGTCVSNLNIPVTNKISKQTTPECPKGFKDSYNGKNWECTTWWRVTVWGKQAESCNQYLTKGSTVYIEGEISGEATDGNLNPRIWTDNGGNHRASFEMTARTVRFLSTKREDGHSESQQSGQEAPPVEEESIPF